MSDKQLHSFLHSILTRCFPPKESASTQGVVYIHEKEMTLELLSDNNVNKLEINEQDILLALKYLINFEQKIRLFIIEKLKQYYKEKWWELGVPKDIQNDIEARKKIREKNMIPGGAQYDLIDFMTFYDYKCIIFRKSKNWPDIFEKIFITKYNLAYPLDQITLIRNDLAHSRYEPGVLKRIEVYAQEILRFLN